MSGKEGPSPEMVELGARAMFAVGRADAHGGDIYDEQAAWWEDCFKAGLAALDAAGYLVIKRELVAPSGKAS